MYREIFLSLESTGKLEHTIVGFQAYISSPTRRVKGLHNVTFVFWTRRLQHLAYLKWKLYNLNSMANGHDCEEKEERNHSILWEPHDKMTTWHFTFYILHFTCVGKVLSFFSSRRNWDSPNPSPADECAH